MARINFKTIAKNVDYTTFATYQEMLSYAGGSLSYPGQILGVLQAHDTPDNVTPFILDANKTPVGIASFSKVQEMIEDRIGNMAGALVLQGHAPSTEFNQALTNHTAGWVFVVITAGTYIGQQCNIGDMIICETTGTEDNNDDWFVLESNQPNMVTSSSSSMDEGVVVFDGTSGKVVKNSGLSLSAVISNTTSSGLVHPPAGGTGSPRQLSTDEVNAIKKQLGVTTLEEEIVKTIPILTATGQTYSSGDTTKKFTLTHTNGKAFNGYGLALVQFTGDMNYLSTIQQTILTFGSDSYTAFLNKVTTIQAIGHKNRSVLSAYSYFFVFFNTSTAQFLCECWEDDGELRLPSGASIALEGDITAPKSMQGVDLDTLTDIGVYYGVPQNKSGQPTASDFASLFVLRGNTDPELGIIQVYYADNTKAAWRVKPSQSSPWTDWKSVGVDEVTLWGQSFDGTNNVSGEMTGVGAVNASGNHRFIIPDTGSVLIGNTIRGNDSTAVLLNLIRAYCTDKTPIDIRIGGIEQGLVNILCDSGNVGIGTPNPTEKLDVNGNGIIRGTLTVSGGINGNASSATKLNNKRTIDGIDFDGTANINHQVVVSGAADDVAKTITKTGLTVKDGLELTAHFPNAHVKENMTLSINGGEAIPVLWPGGSLYGLPNNQVLDLVYRAGSFYVVGSRKRVVFNSISEFHEGFENGLITVGDYASINGSGGGIVEHIGDSASIKYFATMDWVEQQIAASNASIISRAIQALMVAFSADTQVSSNNIISVNIGNWSNIGTSVQNKVKQYIDTDNCIFHINLSSITNISALSDDEAVTLLINNVFDGARTIKFGTTNLTGRMVKGLFNANPILTMRCFNDDQHVRLCGIDSIIYDGRIYYPTGDYVEYITE